jgi:hypothetical protein
MRQTSGDVNKAPALLSESFKRLIGAVKAEPTK